MDLSQPVKTKWPVIALIVVIAGGIGLSVWFMLDDSPKAAPKGRRIPEYVCDQCGKHFTLAREQFAEQIPDERITRTDPAAVGRPHCPLCQARHSGLTTVRCPKCGKAYAPPGQGSPGPARADEPKDICPYCKTDRSQWYRDHRGDGVPQG